MNKDQVNYTVKKIEAYNEKIAQIDKNPYKGAILGGIGIGLTLAEVHDPLKVLGLSLAGASAIYITVTKCQIMNYRNRIEALEYELGIHDLETKEKPKEYIIK